MENKDQRNQIPEDLEGKQDEKTSQTKNEHVEASPQTDENQDTQTTTEDEVKEKEPVADATTAPAVSTAKAEGSDGEKAKSRNRKKKMQPDRQRMKLVRKTVLWRNQFLHRLTFRRNQA